MKRSAPPSFDSVGPVWQDGEQGRILYDCES